MNICVYGSADNYEQRLKRVSFYEKNGICRTGYGFSTEGVDYFVLASDTKNFDPSECKKLFGGISLITELIVSQSAGL